MVLFLGVNQNIDGGYADKGSSLFDEEVRVPLIIKIADNNRINGTTISTPTAHVDLFPTLYDLAGGTEKNKNWKGIDLYPALKADSRITIPELLANRDSIYFDGHKYAGILYWGEGFKQNPMKYIRQLAPDKIKLYLTHNPWSEKISWYQPEMFSSVDFMRHSEKLLPIIPNEKLSKLRSAYFEASPSNKIIRFTTKYEGDFSLNIQLKLKDNSSQPNIALQPEGIKVKETKSNNFINYSFNGKVKPNESIWINLGDTLIQDINLAQDITPITCPNGNKIQSNLLAHILQNNICTFFAPDGIIEANYTEKEKPVIIQKSLSSEQVEQIEGTGAGTALQNALRDWGYAK